MPIMVRMKGFLKNPNDGIFQLSPKVTTIGREGCDLVIKSPGVDHQHAVIEYSEQEDCYVLQDLNTSQGTYVNECRVQNAAVRMAAGDAIRFGYGGLPYELCVEDSSQLSCPPVQQRPAWTQPLQMLNNDQMPSVPMPTTDTRSQLPQLGQGASPPAPAWGQVQTPQVVPRPPPATLRSRPLSAGSIGRRPVTDRPPPGASPNLQSRTVTGWVGPNPTNQNDIMQLQDKEQRILRLQEEVRRLQMYEVECARRDELLGQLKEEVADLQNQLRQAQTGHAANLLTTDSDTVYRMQQLERELQNKTAENGALREQMTRRQLEDGAGSPISRQDFNDRVLEVNSLRTELERVKKDKNITTGLVTQMQRDMANKDTSVSRLTRDMDNLKKEIKEKDVQLASMQMKNEEEEFKKTQENRRLDEDIDSKEKELVALRNKFKTTENRVQEQNDVIMALKEELDRVKQGADRETESQRSLQSQLDQSKARSQDLERAERLVRVDLEQGSKRMERFRNRVIQVTYSTPGIRAPDKEINDDELLEALKGLIDERTELTRKIQDMSDQLNTAHGAKKEIIESSKKIKQQLNESVGRLKEKGLFSSRLKQELDLIQVVTLDDDTFTWIKDQFTEILQGQNDWESRIEAALEECGVNVKLSDDAPSVHIEQLGSTWKQAQDECAELRQRMEQMGDQHKTDVDAALENLRSELGNNTSDEVEKARLEAEEKLSRMIDEIRELESEKREAALEAERAKIAELEISIEQLKASILEREGGEEENREMAREAVQEMESQRKLADELREQLQALQATVSKSEEDQNKALQDKSHGHEAEVDGYKEQIRQHSVTICAMEERLNKVMKKNKDYHAEMAHLRNTITELRTKRPSPPPKPKVIVQKPAVDVTAMEQTVLRLQRENADYKRQMAEQQDVIVGLRRDLAGAAARLSDMTGELSESQKEEIERSRTLTKRQETELNDLRQQMVKLSEIVDKQANEIAQLNTDHNKQQSALGKYKGLLSDRDAKIQDLEEMLGKEKDESKKQLSLIEEEGRITSELTALGAQCRGERHGQVIERQREALTELRARIKALEMTRPPVPNHDQALQQVVMLKKELTDLRASQSGGEDSGIDTSILDQQISRARGIDPQNRAHSEIERSAHRETLESLELGEESYLTLLRGVASALELDSVPGLRSMAHLQRDERQRLASEREQGCELVTSRIKVMKERIGRKDDLLQGYERDLAKLRQAEALADSKHNQVETLTGDIRSKTEESQYLRETLQRTKDKLEQEKRLNSAIKQKKTYHLENEKVARNGFPKHHCPPEDPMGKNDRRKKIHNEKIKRKNYEIRTLKGELGMREQDVSDARRRLITYEGALGVDIQRDPLEPPSITGN